MSDDTLLKALAEQARSQNGIDSADLELWEKYAASSLGDDEFQALLARTPTEEVERLKSAYAPLKQDFKDSLATSIIGQLDSSNNGIKAKDPESSEKAANIVTLNTWRKKIFAPVAVAATLLLAVGAWQFGLQAPGVAATPDYTLSLLGGSAFRSSQAVEDVPVFSGGDRLEIRLTPSTAIDTVFVGSVFADSGQELVALPGVLIDRASTGAFRLTGTIGETLPLDEGPQRLIVLVHSEGNAPKLAKLYKQLNIIENSLNPLVGNGWQAWRVDVAVDSGS